MVIRGIGHRLVGMLGMLGAAVLMPAPGWAQGAATLPAAVDPVELPRVLPVWSNDSGRIEALLLVDEARSRLNPSPLEQLFGKQAPVATPRLGLSTRVGVSRNVDLKLGLDVASSSAMALLCDGNVGLAVALGRLSEQCLLTRLGADSAIGTALQSRLNLSTDWSSPSGTLDFSFGLSWLDTRITQDPLGALPFSDERLGILPALAGQVHLEGQELALQGSSWLGPRSWLRVEGRRSHNRLSGIDAASFGLPLDWDDTSLSLSGGYRSFSGSITGKLIELDHPRESWTDVDLNFSWRTPWDARVSVGAKNLLGGPDRQQWPLSNLPGLPTNESRTPYVRYHQDL